MPVDQASRRRSTQASTSGLRLIEILADGGAPSLTTPVASFSISPNIPLIEAASKAPSRTKRLRTTSKAIGARKKPTAEPTPALPLVRAGKIRALGVSSITRLPPAPDIPTLAEAGVPGFNFVSWQMIVAPAGTPKPIVDRLPRELKAIIALPEVQQEYVKTGRISVDSPPPEELLAFMRSEIVRLGKVVESAGIARSQ